MRQRESGAEGSPYGRGFRSRNRITGKEKVFGRSFDTVTLCEPEPGTPPPPYPQTTTRLPQPTTPGCAARVPEGGRPGAPHPPPPAGTHCLFPAPPLGSPCSSFQKAWPVPQPSPLGSGQTSHPFRTPRAGTVSGRKPCRSTRSPCGALLCGRRWANWGPSGVKDPLPQALLPLRLAWDHIGWIQLSKSLSNTYNKIQCQTLKTWDRTKTTMNKIC